MKLRKTEFDALLKHDFVAFIEKAFHNVSPGTQYLHNWHIEAIAWHLERVQSGHIKRLIITLPPRSLKSIITSVAYPAWLLGHDPTNNIVSVSYSQDLSSKLALDCRAVMESDWYQRVFSGTRLDGSKKSVAEFMTTRRGGRLSTSVGGTLTGRGGNIIIIDDPHKADEGILSSTNRESVKNWFRNTLSSRLDNKEEDAIIVIQQRLHEDDLAGYLLETGEWVHLNLPAIAEEKQEIQTGQNRIYTREIDDILHPERESRLALDSLKNTLGSNVFAAQYQQRPTPMGGGMIKWEWFKTYSGELGSLHGDLIVQSWDTASKAEAIHDYSVCTTWLIRNKHIYLLHVSRQRLEYTLLKTQVIELANRWNADLLLIEDKGAGISLIQDVQADGGLSISGQVPKDDKETRMMVVSPILEGGQVSIPEEAHWLADFQHELVHFPHGKHDDQVDSVSQFLTWARDHLNTIDTDCIVGFPSIASAHEPGNWP